MRALMLYVYTFFLVCGTPMSPPSPIPQQIEPDFLSAPKEGCALTSLNAPSHQSLPQPPARMLKLPLLIFPIIVTASQWTTKCCSPQEVLSNGSSWECTRSNAVIPLILPAKVKAEGLKSCKDNEICVDKTILGDVVSLDCRKKFRSGVSLERAYKCCPVGFSYSYPERTCKEVIGSVRVFGEVFGKFFSGLNFGVGGPNCTGPKVVYRVKDVLGVGEGRVRFLDGEGRGEVDLVLKRICFDVSDGEVVLVGCGGFQDCLGGRRTCVNKCCPFGKVYFRRKGRGRCEFMGNESFIPEKTYDRNKEIGQLSIISTSPNCTSPIISNASTSTLLKNGTLLLNNLYRYEPHLREYCLEKIFSDDEAFLTKTKIQNGTIQPFICSKWKGNKSKNALPKTLINCATILSCIFLLLTLVVYIILPDLHNTHGKTVICHTFVMLLAFVLRLMLTMPSETSYVPGLCLFIGYMLNYSFVATFTWLNTMCFDIWWTFGSIRSKGINKKGDKKFIWYCIYSFATPAILTAILVIADQTAIFPEPLRPHFNTLRCFYNEMKAPWSKILFFVTPCGILIVSNIIFFVLTVRYFFNVKSNIMKMQDSQQKKNLMADKQTLVTICKLAFIMGVSWSGEIISYYTSEGIFWYIVDSINALQGLWIFLIFLAKPRVLKSIKATLGIKPKDDISNATTTTNVSKQSGFASDSRTSIVNANELVELVEKEKK